MSKEACEMVGARILVNTCGCIKPGENVVVTDTNKIPIAEYILKTLSGGNYKLNKFNFPPKFHCGWE